jgi:hypothetical protein
MICCSGRTGQQQNASSFGGSEKRVWMVVPHCNDLLWRGLPHPLLGGDDAALGVRLRGSTNAVCDISLLSDSLPEGRPRHAPVLQRGPPRCAAPWIQTCAHNHIQG